MTTRFFDTTVGASFEAYDVSNYQFICARDFMHRWFINGSNELAPAPACNFCADDKSISVYASGCYFGKMGLVKIFELKY